MNVQCPCGRSRTGCDFHDPNLQRGLSLGEVCDRIANGSIKNGSSICIDKHELKLFNISRGKILQIHNLGVRISIKVRHTNADGSVTFDVIDRIDEQLPNEHVRM